MAFKNSDQRLSSGSFVDGIVDRIKSWCGKLILKKRNGFHSGFLASNEQSLARRPLNDRAHSVLTKSISIIHHAHQWLSPIATMKRVYQLINEASSVSSHLLQYSVQTRFRTHEPSLVSSSTSWILPWTTSSVSPFMLYLITLRNDKKRFLRCHTQSNSLRRYDAFENYEGVSWRWLTPATGKLPIFHTSEGPPIPWKDGNQACTSSRPRLPHEVLFSFNGDYVVAPSSPLKSTFPDGGSFDRKWMNRTRRRKNLERCIIILGSRKKRVNRIESNRIKSLMTWYQFFLETRTTTLVDNIVETMSLVIFSNWNATTGQHNTKRTNTDLEWKIRKRKGFVLNKLVSFIVIRCYQ